MADTPNLGLPEIAADQAQKHVTHNEALRILDAIVQASVIADDVTAPPGSPAEGDRYIVPAGATGVWEDHTNELAFRQDGAWSFIVPRNGFIAFNEATGRLLYYVTASPAGWVDLFESNAFQNLALLGVDTTADASNPFAMRGPGALFTAKSTGDGGTGDLTLGLNKQAAGDTLQISLQQGFSVRALIGLLADNDLTLKVSPDGSTFFDAVFIDKDDGRVILPSSLLDVARPGDGLDGRVTLYSSSNYWYVLRALGDDFAIVEAGDPTKIRLRISYPTGALLIPMVGVNGAAPDSNNPTATKGGVLHDADATSGDQRTTFNKATSADDCALTFQSGFSARALVGLLGDDNFTFKVSPDGSNYFNGLVIDKDNGAAALPANPKFSAYVNYDKYIGAGAWTNITMNNTRHNDQAAFNTGTNVFTAPHDGYYCFGAGYTFKANSTVPTKIMVGLSVNGATPTPDARGIAGDATVVTLETSVSVTALLKLAAGDTVAAHAFMTTNDGYVLADENYLWGHEAP